MSAQKNRSNNVKVWVRIRQTANFAHDVIDLQQDGRTINIHCPRSGKREVVNNQILDWSFKVDGILHNISQEQTYKSVASDVVTSSLAGYNGTVMCYGQTGAGKTFSITGATENYAHRGMIPRALSQLYRQIQEQTEHSINIRISYMEIYNEVMYDLLTTLPDTASSAAPMTIVEDEQGVYVKGLSCHLARTEEQALNLLFEGETNRAIAAHTLNQHSSRSHCIFTIFIESRSRVRSDAKYTVSKLNFVDLAGSERLGKTKSIGRTQQEAMYINKSLTFLEQTVIALADSQRDHIPFRQTKLTHCLKDSIGGNCNTILVANVWGELAQIEETISTLRFSMRMMCVKTEPAVNVAYDPEIMVQKLQNEITSLKRELAMHDTLTNRIQISYGQLSEQQRFEIQQQTRLFAEGKLQEIDIVNVRQIQGVFEAFRDLCQQMEKDIEDKLRSRYTLLDKTDPVAIAAAQAAGVPVNDEGELVGESDGQGFGLGVTSPSAKPASSNVIGSRKRENKRTRGKDRSVSPALKTTSPLTQSTKVLESSVSVDKKAEKDVVGTPGSGVTINEKPERPSTPPPKMESFENFKKEQGSEIYRILNQNKEIFSNKKKEYAELANKINSTKVAIDKSKAKLEILRTDREEQGNMLNEDGDIIITEDEFLEIRQLKELKNSYKADYEQLNNLKSVVISCQKYVENCRQKLLQEFNTWYAESFLGGITKQNDEEGTKVDEEKYVDEQEQFERLQRALRMENPEAEPYVNAKLRTQRRKTYEAAMKQRNSTGVKNTPIRSVRNEPPTMLEVQY